MSIVGGKIRETRKARKMTLQQLSEKAGVSKSMVWGIEHGVHSNPSLTSVCSIAVALGVTVDYLLGLHSIQEASEATFLARYKALPAAEQQRLLAIADALNGGIQEGL